MKTNVALAAALILAPPLAMILAWLLFMALL
jgi:hypothetical protein